MDGPVFSAADDFSKPKHQISILSLCFIVVYVIYNPIL